MIFKCKPVFNFQSIEFEVEIDPNNFDQEVNTMFDMYDKVLEGLKAVAPEQPSGKAAPVKPQEPMASPKQVEWLVNLGVDEASAKKLTAKQASMKIKELLP